MREPSRRTFFTSAAAAAAGLALRYDRAFAQTPAPKTGTPIHPDVATIDHDRILAAAETALERSVTPITAIAAARSPGSPHDFYSEPEDFFPASTPDASGATGWVRRPNAVNPAAFTAHRDAVYTLGINVAALTAGAAVTGEPRYATRAAEHLRAWFVAPATRMTPSLTLGQRVPGTPAGRPEGIIETVPLAEVARSLRFLAFAEALQPDEIAEIRKWFADFAQWLNESRTGGLARDMKDQHGSSWLFQCAAYADANVTGLTSDDATLNALRHRFRSTTLRAEINANGIFPHVIASANSYRDCLFNLDLLCLACELMTTRFDDPWEFELQDGPGMRAAIAFHFPFILNRATWPYPADLAHFKELPGRRISLLLAGHAYRRPEYVDLWRKLEPLPDTSAPELLRSFPVTQPLLWVTQPRAFHNESVSR